MSIRPIWRLLRRAIPPQPPATANPPGEAEHLLRRLDFTVIRRLDGQRQGEHRNAAYGAGLDLAELREYQPGDDVRTIDWNVTARMGLPYVRRYHEDRDITAWLLLDLTGSTDFGSAGQTKRELLVDVAGTLARLLTARGDRVGALLYTGSHPRRGARHPTRRQGGRRRTWWGGVPTEHDTMPAELVSAAGGRTHVLRLLQRALDAVRRVPAPGAVHPAPDTPVTDLAALLEQAFRTARQRSLVVVLSDFLDAAGADEGRTTKDESASVLRPSSFVPQSGSLASAPFRTASTAAVGPAVTREQAWERALAPLARRHEVVGVWIRDPREVQLPDVGVVTFEDAETGQQLAVDTSQPSLRAAYAARAAQRAAQVERTFARHGAALWQLSTAEPLVPALVTFVEQRRRTLLGAQRLLVE